MNEISNTQEISFTPAIANPIGKKVGERAQSVLVNSNSATALALINEKGAVGKAAREIAAQGGVVGIIQHCANSNYKSLVDYLAIKLNGAVIVRNRAEYALLPTILDMRIMDAEAKGTVTGEKLAAKLRIIKSDVVEIQAAAEELFLKRKAEREEQAAKQLEAA